MARIVTAGVAASAAGCTTRTIRRWADAGLMPQDVAFRPYPGAHWRFHFDAFRAWLEKVTKADKTDQSGHL